jgi:predicted nucleic acid-binding protein
MILVDSSVWIDYFNGHATWQTNMLDNLLSDIPIIMGDLILTEILQGFRSDEDFESAMSYLGALQFREIGGYQVAVRSAQNYRTLRKKGITVRKTIDIIIGTFCILNDFFLLHDDRDFTPMVDHFSLKVLTPD